MAWRLQSLRGFKIGAWNLDPHGSQFVQKARANAGRLKMSDHAVVRPKTGTDIFEDLLHLDDITFKTRDLCNACDFLFPSENPGNLTIHRTAASVLPRV